MKFYTYKKIIIVNNFSHQNIEFFILEIFVFSWTLKPLSKGKLIELRNPSS